MAVAIAGVGCAALFVPATARAAVSINAEEVIVEAAAGSAVIERSPFRIRFRDRRGEEVLREIEPGGSLPVRPPGFDPAPGGVDPLADPGIYAPLAFEIGGERSFQWYGGFWQGNMLTSARAGTIHHATEVTAAEAQGDSARLTVSTTDPLRTLEVTVGPDLATGIRVRASVSNPDGVSAIGDAFASQAGESFFGFGGRHDELDQRGSSFYNWSEQENFGAGPFAPISENTPGFGGDRYMAPNGRHAAYYPQSLFVSSRPYGFFLDGTPLSRWRMASDRDDAWNVSIGGAELDYTVALGQAPEAIETLTQINGRQRVPPRWAVGPTLSRSVTILSSSADTPESYRRKVSADIEEIERRGLPVEAYTYESWAVLGEDFVRRTNERLRSLGITPMGYMRAFLAPDGVIEPEGPYAEAIEKGYVATTPAGTPYYYLSGVSPSQAVMIDFTDPEAVQWWQRRVREMLDLGFDGFMNDFGEQVLADMRFDNGETGVTMHNRYPVLFHQVTREATDAWERDNPERSSIFIYTRAGFSGRPGAAAYESSNFPGDETTDWNRATGIPSLATDMLNRGIGGAVGFNTDIGGYIDSYTSDLDEELFVRWAQWAALAPAFRVHNACCKTGQVMPWTFGEDALSRWRAAAELHLAARPLILELWRQHRRDGMPIARPLWLEYPGDPEAIEQDQQWLLGEDVLVAPVVEEGADTRRVYFPKGCWESPETGLSYRGGYHKVPAPIDLLPYFFRCDTKPFAVGRCPIVLRGGATADRLRGTIAADKLIGRAGHDRLRGRRGDDCLRGGRGRDRLAGGQGADQIAAGGGRDRIAAGGGKDRVRAGTGRDLAIVAGGGRDRVDCGPGRDVARAGRGDRVRRCETVER